MTRRLVVAALVAACLGLLAVGAFAATWTHVGTSGVTTDPAQFQDWRRIRINSMVVDAQGNVYAAVNNGENSTYTYTGDPIAGTGPVFNNVPGGVMIFKTNGTAIDIRLSDFSQSNWNSYCWGPAYPLSSYPGRSDSKFVGGITKLVVARGSVYALLNYQEIHWGYGRQNNRIVRINPDGTATHVWTPTREYGPENVFDPNSPIKYGAGILDWRGSWTETNDQIMDMTVGDDQNLYWTMNGGDAFWKWHYIWRYNTQDGTVEEAVNHNLPDNMALGDKNRLFEFISVGNNKFAIVGTGSANWYADYYSWDDGRKWGVGVANGSSLAGWGRDHATALCYDPVRNKLWAGGRGTAGSNPWSFSADGGTAVISGDGIMITKGGQTYYRFNFAGEQEKVSLAARFAIDSYSADFDGTMLQLRAAPGMAPDAPYIAVKVQPEGNYILWDCASNVKLADLEQVEEGDYNECYLTLDSTASKAQCWWNGVKVYDGPVARQTQYSWDGALFGAATRDGGMAGTCVATFDWVRCAPELVQYGGNWPVGFGFHLDGTILPQSVTVSTNIMSRWDGAWWKNGLFDDLVGDTATGIVKNLVWHANNNDPNASSIGNGGHYWIQTMAINPADGKAWMAFGAEPSYDFDEIGTVWTRDIALNYGSEGVPEPGAIVTALAFGGGKAYALTCNLTTGVYNLYSASVPNYTQPTSISQAKMGPVGRSFTTDEPKIVTWSGGIAGLDYFYIEDDDRSSGIRVKYVDGTLPSAGQRASVTGILSVEDGEAVVLATSVTAINTTDTIEPLIVPVRSIGGAQTGVQPAVLAGGSDSYAWLSGLNTTGLLIKVTGKLVEDFSGEQYVDDGSGYPIRLTEYTSAYHGDIVAVTGISSVVTDGAGTPFRVLIPISVDVF